MNIEVNPKQYDLIIQEAISKELEGKVRWSKSTFNYAYYENYIPLTDEIIEILFGKNARIKTFHFTGVGKRDYGREISPFDVVKNIKGIQGKKNTISSFIYGRKDWVSRMNGVWFGGILLELEGTLVINAGEDIMSKPEIKGKRRWVPTRNLFDEETEKLFNKKVRELKNEYDNDYSSKHNSQFIYVMKYTKMCVNFFKDNQKIILKEYFNKMMYREYGFDYNETLVKNIEIKSILWNPQYLFNYDEEEIKLYDELYKEGKLSDDEKSEYYKRAKNFILMNTLLKTITKEVYLAENDEQISDWFIKRGGYVEYNNFKQDSLKKSFVLKYGKPENYDNLDENDKLDLIKLEPSALRFFSNPSIELITTALRFNYDLLPLIIHNKEFASNEELFKIYELNRLRFIQIIPDNIFVKFFTEKTIINLFESDSNGASVFFERLIDLQKISKENPDLINLKEYNKNITNNYKFLNNIFYKAPSKFLLFIDDLDLDKDKIDFTSYINDINTFRKKIDAIDLFVNAKLDIKYIINIIEKPIDILGYQQDFIRFVKKDIVKNNISENTLYLNINNIFENRITDKNLIFDLVNYIKDDEIDLKKINSSNLKTFCGDFFYSAPHRYDTTEAFFNLFKEYFIEPNGESYLQKNMIKPWTKGSWDIILDNVKFNFKDDGELENRFYLFFIDETIYTYNIEERKDLLEKFEKNAGKFSLVFYEELLRKSCYNELILGNIKDNFSQDEIRNLADICPKIIKYLDKELITNDDYRRVANFLATTGGDEGFDFMVSNKLPINEFFLMPYILTYMGRGYYNQVKLALDYIKSEKIKLSEDGIKNILKTVFDIKNSQYLIPLKEIEGFDKNYILELLTPENSTDENLYWVYKAMIQFKTWFLDEEFYYRYCVKILESQALNSYFIGSLIEEGITYHSYHLQQLLTRNVRIYYNMGFLFFSFRSYERDTRLDKNNIIKLLKPKLPPYFDFIYYILYGVESPEDVVLYAYNFFKNYYTLVPKYYVYIKGIIDRIGVIDRINKKESIIKILNEFENSLKSKGVGLDKDSDDASIKTPEKLTAEKLSTLSNDEKIYTINNDKSTPFNDRKLILYKLMSEYDYRPTSENDIMRWIIYNPYSLFSLVWYKIPVSLNAFRIATTSADKEFFAKLISKKFGENQQVPEPILNKMLRDIPKIFKETPDIADYVKEYVNKVKPGYL
jgi:hypothetical protein